MADSPLTTMTSTSRRHFLAGAALLGAGAAGLVGCGTETKEGNARTGKSGDTLFLAGMQWGTPENFNPLGTSAAFPCGQNNFQLVYESLVRFNQLDGGLTPGLSTGLEVSDTNIVVPLQEAAKWQDGKPVTPDDVVYTYELSKTHTELSYATFWDYVTKIEKTGDLEVTVTFNPDRLNIGMTLSSLAGTWILPMHVWQDVEKEFETIGEFENLEPLGSGPYKINLRESTQVGLERHDDYWGQEVFGGLPAPKYIVHPVFKDNGAGDIELEQGGVDASQQFTPQVWKMWQDKDLPVSTWSKKPPYHVPGGIPQLVVNNTKKGLDNPKVRRALAFCIDYARIAETAMSKYSEPVNSSLILPTGAEEKFFDAENVKKYGWRTDPKESVRILEEDLGAKKGSDGIYALPDGTRLGPWTAQTPTGWTDYQSSLRIVAENAKAVGIDISTEFPQAPQVTSSVQNGDFDFVMWGVASQSPATPWQRFRDVLEDRGVPDVGETAFWNYGRFRDPAVHEPLDAAARAQSDAEKKTAYAELDRIFMENAPMIPLVYRPLQFFEYNETTWQGFPSEEDPYAPPQFLGAGIDWLYKIKRVES